MSYSTDIADTNEKVLIKYLPIYEFTWTIKNFRTIGAYQQSPSFYSGANKEDHWSIDVFPTGIDKDSKDYVSIRAYLFYRERNDIVNFVAKCSIIDKVGKKHASQVVVVENKSSSDKGIIKRFILREKLLSNAEILSNDELRIMCEIFDLSKTDGGSNEAMASTQPSPNGLLKGCKKLLDTQKFSDFKLVVKGKEFYVHRAILGSQSPVFEAMFESKMLETMQGKADIEDIEPEVMEKILHFLYAGEIDFGNLAEPILVAAEKYQFDSLKSHCEDVLAERLNINNVYDILLLAEQNNAVKLKNKSVKFFDNNMKQLVEGEDFGKSAQSLPKNVLTDIIRACALKR